MSEHDRPAELSGEKARQGEIILRTPLRKAIFLTGLAGLVILSVLLATAGCIPTA